MQNNVRSISVGSCGTMPWTSRSSLAGNQAGSVSSTIIMPKSLENFVKLMSESILTSAIKNILFYFRFYSEVMLNLTLSLCN